MLVKATLACWISHYQFLYRNRRQIATTTPTSLASAQTRFPQNAIPHQKIALIFKPDNSAFYISTVLSRTVSIDAHTHTHTRRVCIVLPFLVLEKAKIHPDISVVSVFRVKWWNRYGYSTCMNNQI